MPRKRKTAPVKRALPLRSQAKKHLEDDVMPISVIPGIINIDSDDDSMSVVPDLSQSTNEKVIIKEEAIVKKEAKKEEHSNIVESSPATDTSLDGRATPPLPLFSNIVNIDCDNESEKVENQLNNEGITCSNIVVNKSDEEIVSHFTEDIIKPCFLEIEEVPHISVDQLTANERIEVLACLDDSLDTSSSIYSNVLIVDESLNNCINEAICSEPTESALKSVIEELSNNADNMCAKNIKETMPVSVNEIRTDNSVRSNDVSNINVPKPKINIIYKEHSLKSSKAKTKTTKKTKKTEIINERLHESPVVNFVLLQDRDSPRVQQTKPSKKIKKYENFKIAKQSKSIKRKQIVRSDAFTQTANGKLKPSDVSCQNCHKNFLTGKMNESYEHLDRILQLHKKTDPKSFQDKRAIINVKPHVQSDLRINRTSVRPHKVPTTNKSNNQTLTTTPIQISEKDKLNLYVLQESYNGIQNQTDFAIQSYQNYRNSSPGYYNDPKKFCPLVYRPSCSMSNLVPRGAYESVQISKKEDIKRIGRFQELYDHSLKKKYTPEIPDVFVDEPMNEIEAALREQEEALFGSILSDDEVPSQCSSVSAVFSSDESEKGSICTMEDDQVEEEFDENMYYEQDCAYEANEEDNDQYWNVAGTHTGIESDIQKGSSSASTSASYLNSLNLIEKTPLELYNEEQLDFDEMD